MNERDSHYRVLVHVLRMVNRGIQSRKRSREGEEQEVVKSSLFSLRSLLAGHRGTRQHLSRN